MATEIFIMSQKKTIEQNASDAVERFPFLNETESMNLMLWLKDRPSLCGCISLQELETLKGVVWS